MANGSDTKVSRRWILKATGIGVGAAAVGVIVLDAPLAHAWTRAVAGTPAAHARPAVAVSGPLLPPPAMPALQLDDGVAAFLGPIAPGTSLGEGLRIKAVRGVHLGAIALLIEDDAGNEMRLDILRRDPQGPSAPASTDAFDVFIANQGRGSMRTDDKQLQAAQQVAQLLAQRETIGVAVPALLTHAERRAQHPRGIYSLDA